MIQYIGIGLVIWWSARSVLNYEVTVGIMIAFIMYLQMFFRPIRMIADRFNTLQLGIVSSSRILKLLDSEEHIQNDGTLKPTKISGDIKLENVWFAYNDEEYVLKDINLDIKIW